MKLCEVLKRISNILNMNEGEKIYISEKRGYLLKGGKIWNFYDDKNKQYETVYTKEEFIDIQYDNALNILIGIEVIDKMLTYIPLPPNINLYNSDISVDIEPYPDKTPMPSRISTKSMNNNHMILIIYQQSDCSGFEMRIFDIDIVNYHMVLHILEGKESMNTMDYYKRSGMLSKKSISVIGRELKGANGQSSLNTSYDMYFEDCSSYEDMISKTKIHSCRKWQKNKLLNQ